VLGRTMHLKSRRSELRRWSRYRLEADAVFAWANPNHGVLLGDGVTRDIGLAGAFISATSCPPIGAKVELDVVLYSRTGRKDLKVRVLIDSTVIRVEHSIAGDGFAIANHEFCFATTRGKYLTKFLQGKGIRINRRPALMGEAGVVKRS
jgi:hypothetical protein